jgi:hypothetical protein
MSQTITLRLADDVAEWLKSSAKRSGRSVNDLGASLLSEAQIVSEFAEIEFRSFAGERHACLKGLLQVWQIIEVGRQLEMNAEKIAGYFGWPVWRSQAALNYYEAFPDEIDEAIAQNQSIGYQELKRMFPHMRLSEVNLSNPNEISSSRTVDLAAESRAEYTTKADTARAN